jgi:hypothetical protein
MFAIHSMLELVFALCDLIIIGAMLFVVGVAVMVAYVAATGILMKWVRR